MCLWKHQIGNSTLLQSIGSAFHAKLIYHLLARKYHQNLFFFLPQEGDKRMKLQNMVKFPLTGLDMTPHVVKRSQSSWSLPSHWSPWRRPYGLGRDPEDYIYDLYAVCNHHGTMQGGHYTGLQRERLGACADDSSRHVLLVTGLLCFRTSLSLPAGSLPTMRAVFILWFSALRSSGRALTQAGNGVCRWVTSSGSPWTCFLDLTCVPRLRFCSASLRT